MFDFNFLNTNANNKCEKAFNEFQELYLTISDVFSDIHGFRISNSSSDGRLDESRNVKYILFTNENTL